MISVFDGYSLYLENINKLDMNQFLDIKAASPYRLVSQNHLAFKS